MAEVKNKRIQKKRGPGRPPKPGGLDPIYSFRPPKEIAAEIDARAESDGVPRSEALLRLVRQALKKGKGRG